MRCSILLLPFLCIGYYAVAQKIVTYQDKNFIYKISIDSTLSIDSVNYKSSIKSIAIIVKSDNALFQTIIPPENSFESDLPDDQVFIIEDVNFDGLNDLRMVQFIPAAPNIPYYYWTFNNKKRVFQRDTALEIITSPDFDHANKIISSFWRASCCDHGISIYKYLDGKPVLMEEAEEAEDLDDTTKWITTLKKRINGEMKLVSRKIDIDKSEPKN